MKQFSEIQYFRQKWLWAIIIFFPVFSIYGIYEQIIMENPIGEKPISDHGLIWFTILIGVGLPLLFYNIRLKTRVSEEGLHYQFFPIHLKERTISFVDIESFKSDLLWHIISKRFSYSKFFIRGFVRKLDAPRTKIVLFNFDIYN